jgi:progesterone-induced-blocking factor 1
VRDELERRELLHSVQLLRLEVSQKQLVIEAMKTERATELEELREQLADAQHDNKLLKLRLQSLTHAYEREMENVRKTRVEPPLQVAAGYMS